MSLVLLKQIKYIVFLINYVTVKFLEILLCLLTSELICGNVLLCCSVGNETSKS